MAISYWNPDWFLLEWYPEVWFAPSGTEGVPPGELRPEFAAGGSNAAPLAQHARQHGNRRRILLEQDNQRRKVLRRQEDELFLSCP